MNLSGKNIVLIGSTGTLGSSVLEMLEREGANVLAISKTSKSTSYQGAGGGHTTTFGANLRDPQVSKQVDAIAEYVFKSSIFSIICNAAMQGDIGEFCSDDVREFNLEFVMRTNFIEQFNIIKLLSKGIEKGGHIIAISGGGATSSRPNYLAYACSKIALVKGIEILADELPYLFVNSIAPGYMKSRMTEETILAGNKTTNRETIVAKEIMEEQTPSNERKTTDLIWNLLSGKLPVTGRLISAVWDEWDGQDFLYDIDTNPSYGKLRRSSL